MDWIQRVVLFHVLPDLSDLGNAAFGLSDFFLQRIGGLLDLIHVLLQILNSQGPVLLQIVGDV